MVALTIPLRQIPVINRKMVKDVSAKTLFELEWQLTKARAAQKVYNSYHKEKFGRKSEGFKLVYGDTTADWLVQHGLKVAIPLHLRNAPTALMQELGHGSAYRYPHDEPEHFIAENYFPDSLSPTAFYQPDGQGLEEQIAHRLRLLWPTRYE
jgi:hypothetical protein